MKLTHSGSNQTVIEIKPGLTVLFSYQTPVAANIGDYYFRTETKHSVTTSKHINQWLGSVKATLKPQSFFDSLTA